MARSVLESAQRNNANFESRANQTEAATSPSQTMNRLPYRPSHTVLPSLETAMNLLEVFFGQYQVQYPILVEGEFVSIVTAHYQKVATGSYREDPWTKFMINMTFASSLVFLSQENRDALGLAQGFSSNAMADFSTIMQVKSVRTLQCLLLLLLYSVLSSSSAPIWYISGLCMRMCVDLGLHSERTISISGQGNATREEIDTKRRLFWVTYTFDRSLSIMLGRPFTLDDATIDVKFPDQSLPVEKKSQVLHWLKLQRLQSDIVSRLYIIRDDKSHSTCDLTTWIAQMTQQLAAWNDEAMNLTESGGPNIDFWRYWHCNALLILHRPSPASTGTHNQSQLTCYSAAKSLIQLSFIRVNRGLNDFTWLELHYQVMSGITLLFLVWNSPEVRAVASNEWITFKSCLAQWEYVLSRLTERWDRIARPKEVLLRLADATVEVVERGMVKSSGNKEGPRRKRTTDEDRRRSIMEQLGSPGSSGLPQTLLGRESTQLPLVEETSPNGTRVYQPSPTSQAAPLPQDPAMEPYQVPSMQYQANSEMAHPPWPHMQLDPHATNEAFEGIEVAMTTDVSSMLADEVWPSLGPYDNTGVLGSFGLFDYFPMPMTGMEDVDVDGVITDSVLNFRETWDDGLNREGGGM